MFQSTGRLMRLSVQHLSLAVLLALGIAILNFSPRCGFAGDKPSQPPARDAETPKETKAERPPFDLTYLPSDAVGVLAIRPNAIFADPAMEPLARMADKGLAQLRQLFQVPVGPKLSIKEIEQVIGHIELFGKKTEMTGLGLGLGLIVIRVAHDFDWLKLMRQLDPKTKEIHTKDAVYYKSHITNTAIGEQGMEVVYHLPDKRTIVFSTLDLRAAQKGKILRRIGPRPPFSWDKDWKHVEHDLIAFTQVNRQDSGASKKQLVEDPFPEWTRKATTMVAGMDWKEGIDFHAYLNCKDAAAAKQLRREIKALVAGMGQFQVSLIREATDPDGPASEQSEAVEASEPQEIDPASLPPEIALYMQLGKDLVKHARVTRRESTVRVHTTAKINIADMVKMLMFQFQYEAVQEKKP